MKAVEGVKAVTTTTTVKAIPASYKLEGSDALKAAEAAAAKSAKEAEEAQKAAEKAVAKAEALSKELEEKSAIKKTKQVAKANKAKENLTQKYAVQVAAYEIDGKSINMSEYKDLFKEGNVYSRPSGKHIKIRVGVYNSKDEAVKHMKSIRKAGFKQAFVTKEYLEPTKADRSLIMKSTTTKAAPAEKPVVATKVTVTKPKKAVKTKKASKPTNKGKEAPRSTNKAKRQYYVQLAAYQNTKYFPRAKVKPLGKIVNTKNGKYTTMYVTGFPSLEGAIEARNKAIKIGFRRPYIVYKRNGKFVRMKF